MQGVAKMKKLVILSGGLDSTAVFLNLIASNKNVDGISFDYGQKCKQELQIAKKLCDRYQRSHTLIDISNLFFIFGKNQLTNPNTKISQKYSRNIIVPLRNALFLQIASCYALSNGYEEIYLGSHLDDIIKKEGEYLFPDCSPEFLQAFEVAQNKGILTTQKLRFFSPALEGLRKRELIQNAYQIDKESLFNSISCYNNGLVNCGCCDSCINRKRSFKEAGILDETIYNKKGNG